LHKAPLCADGFWFGKSRPRRGARGEFRFPRQSYVALGRCVRYILTEKAKGDIREFSAGGGFRTARGIGWQLGADMRTVQKNGSA
jgi:hypothetical protein